MSRYSTTDATSQAGDWLAGAAREFGRSTPVVHQGRPTLYVRLAFLLMIRPKPPYSDSRRK